jgi:hypothetical protein
MGLTRYDQRPLPASRIITDLVRAVDATNKIETAFAAGGEVPVVSALLQHADTRLVSQYMWTGSIYEPIRETTPTRTITGIQRLQIRSRAAQMRSWGRGGYGDNGTPYLWGASSWNGFDPSDIADIDFLLLNTGGYRLEGSSVYEGSAHAYLADPYAGYDYPTLNPYLTLGDPLYDPTLLVGGAGAPAWTTWAAEEGWDIWEGEPPALVYSMWGVDFANPANLAWNHGWDEDDDGEGLVQIYPVTLAGYGIPGGNTVGWASGVTLSGDPGGPASGGSDSFVNVVGQPIAFPHFLRSVPDGTTINSARVEVLCSGLTRYVHQYDQTIDEETGVLNAATATITETSEGISFALLGGKTVAGDTSRRRQWEVVAGGAAQTVASDLWQIVDVTAICQAYLDTLRSGVWDSFALMASPYAGLVGETDLRGYLAALRPTLTWDYWSDSGWSEAWMGGGDKCWISHSSGSVVEWTDITIGKLVIDFTYPSGENNRAVAYFNYPPMAGLES